MALGYLAYAVFFGIVCGVVAGKRERSPFGWGALGFLFGVFALGVLVALEVPRADARYQANSTPHDGVGATRLCPYCAERIQAAAVKCRFCQSALSSVSDEPATKEHLVRYNGQLVRVADLPKKGEETQT